MRIVRQLVVTKDKGLGTRTGPIVFFRDAMVAVKSIAGGHGNEAFSGNYDRNVNNAFKMVSVKKGC
jgi:hypothetical protein